MRWRATAARVFRMASRCCATSASTRTARVSSRRSRACRRRRWNVPNRSNNCARWNMATRSRCGSRRRFFLRAWTPKKISRVPNARLSRECRDLSLPPPGVLFVCLGNICRSPTAEYVARAEFAKLGLRVPVASRGLGNWHVGQGADPRAVAAARAQGFDLSPHRARQFHEDDFGRFATVLAVDRATLDELRRRVPEEMPMPERFLVAAGLAPRFSTDDGDEIGRAHV